MWETVSDDASLWRRWLLSSPRRLLAARLQCAVVWYSTAYVPYQAHFWGVNMLRTLLGLIVVGVTLVSLVAIGGATRASQADPTKEALEATIAALQTQVSARETAEPLTPTATAPAPPKDPIEMTNVEVKVDPGDGSVYGDVYVRNNTSTPVYVGVQAVCRDSEGHIAGKASGKTGSPVAPHEERMIFFTFPEGVVCSEVEVDFYGEAKEINQTGTVDIPVTITAPTVVIGGSASEEKATSTPVPTAKATEPPIPTPTPVPTANSPLEILDLTTKDAGIGDGSIYVYVEVRNNTGESYSYVGLDGICRDPSGSIVGHGLGNTTNVGPGEEVVITMIFLHVRGCTNVEVKFDSLTGLL
jgi:hypothetical protein